MDKMEFIKNIDVDFITQGSELVVTYFTYQEKDYMHAFLFGENKEHTILGFFEGDDWDDPRKTEVFPKEANDYMINHIIEEGLLDQSDSFIDEEDEDENEEDELDIFMNKLMNKPGKKTVTILSEIDGDPVGTQFEVDGENVYLEEEEDLQLLEAIFYELDGTVIIRYHTGLTKLEGDNEIEMVKVCGVIVEDGELFLIPSSDMELAHTTDAETGKRIPKEPGVAFTTFDELFK